MSLLPLIIAVFLLASFFKIAFIYHVLYVLVAVALLARAWSAYTANRITFTREFEPRLLWGETATVRLRVRNRSRLPVPWLRVRERIPIALASTPRLESVVSLGPGEEAQFEYELHGRQRGWYELGPATVETGDVLGMNLFRREFRTSQRVSVYPKILDPRALTLPSRTPFGAIRTSQPLYEDPARMAGVREYQSGDSLRRIHWPASAAVGRLQVRKLEPAMTLHTVVALDLDLEAYERGSAHYASELAIVVAASLANDLVRRRQEVGLISNGLDPATGQESGALWLPPHKGRAQVTRILDVLARVQTRQSRPMDAALRRLTGELGWGATVVVVTGTESPGLVSELIRLRRAGFSVSLLLITQRTGYSAAESRAEAIGIKTHAIWRESEIDYAPELGARRRALGAR